MTRTIILRYIRGPQDQNIIRVKGLSRDHPTKNRQGKNKKIDIFILY